MQIKNLCPGGFAANGYLITEGNTAVLVDCTASAASVTEALAQTGTRLAAILLTHAHFDHMLTASEVKAATGAPIYLGSGDADLPGDGRKNAHAVFFGTDKTYPEPDHLLQNGDTLTFGDMTFHVMCTPGHTGGSVIFLTDEVAFTGDTIFSEGFGRYDLYGGDAGTLRESLTRIAALPRHIIIYPGHGDPATLSAALDAIKGFI